MRVAISSQHRIFNTGYKTLALTVTLVSLLPMRVHDLAVTLVAAGSRSERVGDVHGEHGFVQSLQLASFLLSDTVLAGRHVKVALCVVNALTLGTETGEGVATGFFGLLSESEGIACGLHYQISFIRSKCGN